MHESFTNHTQYNYIQISHHSKYYTYDYFYSYSLESNNVLSIKKLLTYCLYMQTVQYPISNQINQSTSTHPQMMLSLTGQELYKKYMERLLSTAQLNLLRKYHSRLFHLEMHMVEKSPYTPPSPQSNKGRRISPIYMVSFSQTLIYYYF